MSRSVLLSLRALYRRLPVGFRRRIGAQVTHLTAPALARSVPAAAPGHDGPAGSAVLVGLSRSTLGHGAAARLCAREMRDGGVRLSELDVSQALRASMAEEAAPAAPPDPDADAAVLMLNPEETVQALHGAEGDVLRGKRVCAYWVWELEAAPRRWRKLAGHVPHEIWAPSAFAAEAMRAVFDQPVHVVPHPCALDAPPAPTAERRAAARARFGAGAEDFVAVSSFSAASSLARKNPRGAIAAFDAAFGGADDALLVLRCTNAGAYPQALADLRAAVRDARSNILLIDEPAGWQEVLDLYAACDVYLSLHRSEGFGLNLAEAMLSGRAVIATGWSGNLQFMDESCSALVPPTALVPLRDPQGVYRGAGRWAEPDLDAAVGHLRALKSDPDRRAALAEAGRIRATGDLSGGAAPARLRAGASR